MKKAHAKRLVVVILGPEDAEDSEKFVKQLKAAKNGNPYCKTIDKKPALPKIYFENGYIYQTRVETTKDLEIMPGRISEPPPASGRCHCCGRHISELKPFGKAGDPLVGNFKGSLLLKDFRRSAPYSEYANLALDEAHKACEENGQMHFPDWQDCVIRWLSNKYGKDEGERLFWNAVSSSDFDACWLCRDCIVLNDDEYFERLEIKNKI